MRDDEAFEGYLDQLRRVPFVKKLQLTRLAPGASNPPFAYQLELRTPSGKSKLAVELKKSNLSRPMAEQLAGMRASLKQPFLVLAPSIGSELGELLEGKRVFFMDLAGNCYLDLDGRYVVRIQGNKPIVRASAQKGLRAPAYRVLFALLAEPDLVRAPIRTLAEHAGVSRQAALDIRHRLASLDILVHTRAGFRWMAGRHRDAIDIFLTGYFTTLRPLLVLGRFRTRDSEPPALEARIETVLRDQLPFRWGGAAAAQRLTGHYRGDRTVLHVSELPSDLTRKLQAIPDRSGPLELVLPPSELGMRGATAETAHPLLVYVELLGEGNDRAREAAQEIAERWLTAERFT